MRICISCHSTENIDLLQFVDFFIATALAKKGQEVGKGQVRCCR